MTPAQDTKEAPTPGALRAWLELSRCSNLPTVWSNVVHGLAAGVFVGALVTTPMESLEAGAAPYEEAAAGMPPVGILLDHAFMLLVGMSLIYTAGMVLNDVCDAREDAAHRPARPIPSGRVSRRAAGVVGALMLVAGVAATLPYRCVAVPILAAFLALCVVAYNLLHRVKLLGYLLMPVCRALVLLTAATAYPVGNGSDLWLLHVALPAAVLAVYTAAITLVAWSEHLVGREHLGKIVTTLIAAMPLIDAGLLAWIGLSQAALFCVGCSLATFILQRVVPGT